MFRPLHARPSVRPSAPARRAPLPAVALALAAPLLLSGCAAAGGAGPDAAEAAPAAVTLEDGWAKAGDGMTGVFGSVVNGGAEDVVLARVESPAAGVVELHETVTAGGAATMRPVDGGFAVPAGGAFPLDPGGDHIMLMDLAEPLLAGDEVPLTLHFDDGSSVDVSVLVKDFAGAQERYDDGSGHADDASHDGEHGGH